MSIVSDITAEVYRRLEEDPASPKFWVDQEVRAAVIEATCELCLISGEPEIKDSSLMTLTAGDRFFTVPNGGLALLRMEGPGVVRKTTVFEMDVTKRGWLAETGDTVKRWFPFGIGQFGIYPKLSADSQVSVSVVRIPVNAGPPYTGAEAVPFREEFREALIDYAEHILRFKEAGQDFSDSVVAYDRFLARGTKLSKRGQRLGKLRFSRFGGSQVAVSDVVTR